MAIDLSPLGSARKLLFSIELQPVQGSRFQPTGFPSLGAATYQTAAGVNLLVESAQSMANRLEAVCWDETSGQPVADLTGVSYVRVERQGKCLTSSITEAHRVNSPYMLEGKDRSFFSALTKALGSMTEGAIDRKALAAALLKYDAGSLLHGVFLAKKEIAGGSLRLARALSAFIEAEGVRPAVSGGVKNDRVNPSGSTKEGFGNVPFSREEFTAERIVLYVNLDLAQIRGYALGEKVEKMLVLLALYKLRAFLDGDLRLRTACSLALKAGDTVASEPAGFRLPTLPELAAGLKAAIAACRDQMVVTTVVFNEPLKKGKDTDEDAAAGGDEAGEN